MLYFTTLRPPRSTLFPYTTLFRSVTVLPKRYRRGPPLSLSTIALPGVYSVIVPLPSVVVVVVVVSETCPHANGATTANAMLKSTFLIVFSLSCLVAVAVSLRVPVEFWGRTTNLPPYWIRACLADRMLQKVPLTANE